MPGTYFHVASTELALKYDGSNMTELQQFMADNGVADRFWLEENSGDGTVSLRSGSGGEGYETARVDVGGALEIGMYASELGGRAIRGYTADEASHRYVATHPAM